MLHRWKNQINTPFWTENYSFFEKVLARTKNIRTFAPAFQKGKAFLFIKPYIHVFII